MADPNFRDVWQHTAADPDVGSSPEPAAFRFWTDIKAKQEILELFLGHVYALKPTPGSIIKPYYQQWKLAGYIRTDSSNMVTQDNVDLRAMRVNKEFRDAGSRLVYGRYIFHFNDPENCQWWTKHIGSQNFSNLRVLRVSMKSGWDIPCEIICDLDLCHEEQWQRFFSWLRHRHQLYALVLDFSLWQLVQQGTTLTEERQADVMEWREALLTKLSELRGLTVVNIVDPFEVAIPSAEKDEWSTIMTQVREPLPPANPPPISLQQTLDHLGEMRRQREYRERRAQKIQRKAKKKQKRLERKAKAEASASTK